MNIEIMDITEKPIDLISRSMGTCYGHDDVKESRVKRAFEVQHMSVFEHAKVTFRVEGISRACANQLVRHRMASFCQESQRYVKIDVNNDDWYVTPPSFDDKHIYDELFDDYTLKDFFIDCMDECAEDYRRALSFDISAEDARYLLPNACKTNIVVTMNLREIYHFLYLREDKHAQWEIREMAQELRRVLSEHDEQWKMMMEWEIADGR